LQTQKEKVWDLIVIGAGAAGLMAAGRASQLGHSVLIIEKMPKIARKLKITGKGRCNLTSDKEWSDYEKNIFPKANFFKKAFYHFDNKQLMSLFQGRLKTPLKVEQGQRVFPVSDKASDIIKALDLFARKAKIVCNCRVTSLQKSGGKITQIVCRAGDKEVIYKAHNYLLTTGGLSYSATGSSGDGQCLTQAIGHTLTPCLPSLVGLRAPETKSLQGLSLKNIEAKLFVGNKLEQKEFGELLFTHNGLSGPTILTLSRRAIWLASQKAKIALSIDLKPAVEKSQLLQRVNKEINANPQKQMNNFLKSYLPSKMIPYFLTKLDKAPQSKLLELGSPKPFVNLLKDLPFRITGDNGFEQAIITQGGVSTSEINGKSMRSKLFDNLYFAGEIIDLDGYTGGYNLQIAFSTGYLAGELKK